MGFCSLQTSNTQQRTELFASTSQQTTKLDGWTELPHKYGTQLANEGNNKMSRM
jgi:hypothetical protein